MYLVPHLFFCFFSSFSVNVKQSKEIIPIGLYIQVYVLYLSEPSKHRDACDTYLKGKRRSEKKNLEYKVRIGWLPTAVCKIA